MHTRSHEADDIETYRKPVNILMSLRYWNYLWKILENFSYDPKSIKKKIKNKLSIEIESVES